MKLLFDQNLSRRLVGRLAGDYPGSKHVADVDLDRSTDREIWDFSAEHDFVVISKDSDFRDLAVLLGPPPKVIWLRIGNASTLDILDVLRSNQKAVADFGESNEEAILVISTVQA